MKTVVLASLSIFLLFFSAVNALAEGFNFNIGTGSHWGSSPISTSYKNLKISVALSSQGLGHKPAICLQLKSGKSWKTINTDWSRTVTEKNTSSGVIYTITVKSSSNEYRIFVSTNRSNKGKGSVTYSAY